jgi:EAL domain-containing protein (putative c-di-GMP-specific phosphodiesterase class I)
VFCAGADIAEMSKISLQEFEYMRKAGVELAQGYLFGKRSRFANSAAPARRC